MHSLCFPINAFSLRKPPEIPVLQMEVGVVAKQEYTVPVKDAEER